MSPRTLAGEPLVVTDFEDFYRVQRARLIATVNAACRCGADAATDAVDEAFARALARWSRVARMDAPAGWIFTVARNYLRRTQSRRVVTERERDTPTSAFNDRSVGPSADSSGWELWAAVGELPERERTAVALRYLGDFTERQVAEVMQIAPGTVAATLHSARNHLAEKLAEPMEARDDA